MRLRCGPNGAPAKFGAVSIGGRPARVSAESQKGATGHAMTAPATETPTGRIKLSICIPNEERERACARWSDIYLSPIPFTKIQISYSKRFHDVANLIVFSFAVLCSCLGVMLQLSSAHLAFCLRVVLHAHCT